MKAVRFKCHLKTVT